MNLIPVFSIPYASTGNIDGPEFERRGLCSVLWMILDDDQKSRRIEIVFTNDKAFRYRAEAYVEYASGTYDTLCEVTNSSWMIELKSVCSKESLETSNMRHFIIYLDSYGCLEVIAESAEMIDVAC